MQIYDHGKERIHNTQLRFLFFLRGKGRRSVICINFDILSSRGDFGQFSWNNMHFGKTLIKKVFFLLLHVFMFSKQMIKCETVSFIRDCIFRNYPSQRRHRQHVNTTPFKRIISMCYGSWHHFVISLVLPALYLMLRYTAAPFFTTHDQWRPPWPKSKVNAIISPDVFVF